MASQFFWLVVVLYRSELRILEGILSSVLGIFQTNLINRVQAKNLVSGGSRIFQRRKGAPTYYFGQFSPKNCMKMKNILTHREGAHPWPPANASKPGSR